MALPSGYIKLEYIESTGTQYINTGVSAPEGMRVECQAEFTSLRSGLNMLFGSHDAADPYYRNYLAANSAGNWELGAYGVATFGAITTGRKYSIDVCTISGDIFAKIDGMSYYIGDIAPSAKRSSLSVYLFALHYAGGLLGASAKLYGAKIYLNASGSNPTRDFIPCKNAFGVVGMWDDVNGQFYTNVGTGAFTAGPETKPDLTAHKTLINGTAYTIKGGKCMVNGTVYNILKGRTLIDGTGYDITFKQPVHIYGVEWDWTSSGATRGVRTDEAANFPEPNPAVSNGTGSSPFDDLYPWCDMVRENRAGGIEVKEPKYWFKWTKNGKKLKLQIADGPVEGFFVDPVNRDRGDGLGELSYSYIGRYHCVNGYKSTTGAAQQVNITKSQARSGIHNLGANFWQMDFAQFWYVNMLFLVEFADWNGERIGRGCSTSGSKMNNGQTDAMGYHTGTTAASRDSYGFTQYRNIEGWWDNVYDWMDGCYYNNNGLNVISNPNNFSDNANGTLVGRPTGGYPSDFAIPTASGLEWALYPSAANGSTTTYVPDYWNFGGSFPCLRHGGDYNQYQGHGPFYVDCDRAWNSNDSIGCRLQERPPK
nr:MAG TPA: hypothetical protein [Bacteriophage sp.]